MSAENWSEPINSGKAIEIEAGKTYVVELERSMTTDQLEKVAAMWQERTGSKVIFLDGGKIARTGVDEAELREQIAQDIEKAAIELKSEAREISADAYLVTNRVTMACAAIARGLVK